MMTKEMKSEISQEAEGFVQGSPAKMNEEERRKRLLAAIGKHSKNERAKKGSRRASK